MICSSGCLAGEVNYYASIDDYSNARRAALEYHEIFGDRFYLEVQNHGLKEEIKSLESGEVEKLEERYEITETDSPVADRIPIHTQTAH